MQPVLDVDTEADAGYVTLREGSVARTDQFSDSVLVDVDNAGIPVGIEILTLAADVDVDGIVTRYNIPEIRDGLRNALGRAHR
jgi:uncharacterized protein YuzE